MKEETLPAPAEAASERWLHGAVEESGHRGKGPRNYRRSDARIFEDVCEALAEHDGIDATDVEVAVMGGEVVLDGSVSTQRMKEMAEEATAAVAGVKTVRNLLRTRPVEH